MDMLVSTERLAEELAALKALEDATGDTMLAEQARADHAVMMRYVTRLLCAGLVHGDLALDNVVLTSTGVPRVSDLGLARSVNGKWPQGTPLRLRRRRCTAPPRRRQRPTVDLTRQTQHPMRQTTQMALGRPAAVAAAPP